MTCGYRNCQSRACGSIVRPDGHELAYCVAHEAIARHLPPLRSATCCTSEGCGRPQGSRSPLCKSCRPRYAAWGLDGYPVPQEAPMPTTPEAQTPPVTPYDVLDATAKAWFAMPQEERDACLVAISVATISTGESAPMPPAAPQDAAGGVTTQSGGYLACIGCGDEDLMDLDQTTGLCGMCSRQQVRESKERDYEDNYVPVSEPVPEDIIANAKAIPWADYGYQVPTVELLARPDCHTAANDPDIVAVHWPVGQLHTPKPPAKVTEADFEPLHPLEARRDRLVATLLGAGFEEKPAISGRVRRFAYCNDYWVIVPNGPAAESQEDFARALDTAEAALKRLTSTVDAPHLPVVPAPVDAVEPSAADVDDAPLFVGSTDSAPMQPMSPDLAALAARGQQPTAPGPAVAELQQQLAATRDALTRIASQLASVALWAEVEKSPAPEVDGVGLLTTRYLVDRESAASERARADLSDAVAVSQRQRADAAEEQLAAIAALLDPEDAPAYDNDDQPIPLPVRVQTALMPPSTPSAREKRLQEAVDAYSQQLSDVDDVLHWLGAYGNTPTVDRLMKVLTPEDRRNILELRAAIVREDIARLKARRLNPPPCGRMEEHAADLAAIEAKIAALDAGEVRE